ncbi:MAG: acyltransferase [Phaeodactylibacter sp.]|nr:acyltransferase [Phaeodactylibacter sp.]
MRSSSTFSDSKRHYKILDALRGVAALVVVVFHIFEVYSGGDHTKQWINHGYLALDFFFVLSGFVIAHAYDDRWSTMTMGSFFKRRLIRLHPMIIFGMTVGAICFYFGESDYFPKIADTGVLNLLVILLIGYTLLPIPPSADIRGWSEMHPLNGPSWTLFFEYIANILYALVLRKLPKIALAVLTFLAALALLHLAVTSPKGDIIGGWALDAEQLRIGFTRLLYPFLAGMLLRRMVPVAAGKNTFLICSLLLVAVLSFPRVGSTEHLWANGLYDALVLILVFPLIIYWGAKGTVKHEVVDKICTFLGDISYPIYIIHFPFIYVFYAWVVEKNIPVGQGALVGAGILIGTVILSYAALKFYDEPLRRRLAKRYLYKGEE